MSPEQVAWRQRLPMREEAKTRGHKRPWVTVDACARMLRAQAEQRARSRIHGKRLVDEEANRLRAAVSRRSESDRVVRVGIDQIDGAPGVPREADRVAALYLDTTVDDGVLLFKRSRIRWRWYS